MVSDCTVIVLPPFTVKVVPPEGVRVPVMAAPGFPTSVRPVYPETVTSSVQVPEIVTVFTTDLVSFARVAVRVVPFLLQSTLTAAACAEKTGAASSNATVTPRKCFFCMSSLL
jgi:hypothetical protein